MRKSFVIRAGMGDTIVIAMRSAALRHGDIRFRLVAVARPFLMSTLGQKRTLQHERALRN